ncbi:MAG TPA: YncE family protein, partial [Methylocella sp.]|nr:YncE family protein [Methylocella sp.]
TPDGKQVYVTSKQVSAIDTATNMVVAQVRLGDFARWVAVTPDGKYAYAPVYSYPPVVVVIATATNTGVAGILFPSLYPKGLYGPVEVAFTPDGQHAYLPNPDTNSVFVGDTATNTVEAATIPVGSGPFGVAVAPDGKHVYVTDSNNVSVIATASNTVVATIPVGSGPFGVAVTPDGKHVYVAGGGVSVIDTASNTVVATVPGVGSFGVGIVPPPAGVPFLAFNARLAIAFGAAPNEDSFNLHSTFTLSSTAPGLHPHRDPVTLQVGTFSITIPPRSFREQPDGSFFFAGVMSGVSLKAQIYHTGTLQYAFHAKATGASLTGTKNMAYVTLIISGDSGATSVTAKITP